MAASSATQAAFKSANAAVTLVGGGFGGQIPVGTGSAFAAKYKGTGGVSITFLGDGRPLGKPIQVTGKAAPQPVRLKLDGVESLLIRVDFGEDGLDFADHVDIVAARLIK